MQARERPSGSVIRTKACMRAVTEQGGVLLDAGIDRSEGCVGAEHVERCRLVELGDDEGEEGVEARQVDIGQKTAQVPCGADEEDEQQPDDQRREHQGKKDAELDDPRAAGGALGRAGRRAACRTAPWHRELSRSPRGRSKADRGRRAGPGPPGWRRSDRCWISTANGPSSASQITSAPSKASTVEERATMRDAVREPWYHPGRGQIACRSGRSSSGRGCTTGRTEGAQYVGRQRRRRSVGASGTAEDAEE